MTTAITAQEALWSEEPSGRPGRARIRARIGGLHCSLCTGTIEKALGRQKGVEKVAVSLTHEQALVEFDPQVVKPEALLQGLRDIGYTIHDPNKLCPFEEEAGAQGWLRRASPGASRSNASYPACRSDERPNCIRFSRAMICCSFSFSSFGSRTARRQSIPSITPNFSSLVQIGSSASK